MLAIDGPSRSRLGSRQPQFLFPVMLDQKTYEARAQKTLAIIDVKRVSHGLKLAEICKQGLRQPVARQPDLGQELTPQLLDFGGSDAQRVRQIIIQSP